MIISTRRIILATETTQIKSEASFHWKALNRLTRIIEIDDGYAFMLKLKTMKDGAVNLEKFKPAVSKYFLMALAGLMWSVVGIMLCRLAYTWLKAVSENRALLMGFLGLVSALVVYRFGFSKIALKNIARLCLLPDKTCIFAFQAWKSYLIIIFMVMLGITMRHSPMPKHFLAVIYETIGGALFFSSFHFYQRIWQVKIRNEPCITSEER